MIGLHNFDHVIEQIGDMISVIHYYDNDEKTSLMYIIKDRFNVVKAPTNLLKGRANINRHIADAECLLFDDLDFSMLNWKSAGIMKELVHGDTADRKGVRVKAKRLIILTNQNVHESDIFSDNGLTRRCTFIDLLV